MERGSRMEGVGYANEQMEERLGFTGTNVKRQK